VSRSRLAAVNLADASVTSFNPGPNNTVESLAVTADGTAVYLGGHQRYFDNPYGTDLKGPGPGAVARPGIGATQRVVTGFIFIGLGVATAMGAGERRQ